MSVSASTCGGGGLDQTGLQETRKRGIGLWFYGIWEKLMGEVKVDDHVESSDSHVVCETVYLDLRELHIYTRIYRFPRDPGGLHSEQIIASLYLPTFTTYNPENK
jgi:hypothetical protein